MSLPCIKYRVIAIAIANFLLSITIVVMLGNPPSTLSQDQSQSVLIESDDPLVEQNGNWTSHIAENASGGSYLFSSGDIADTLTLNFEGTRVEIVFVKHESFGGFAIEIDNSVRRTVVTSGEETTFGNSAIIDYLDAGSHTLRVYPVEGVIAIDAFITTPSGSPRPEASAQQSVELSGVLTYVYGDPQAGGDGQFIVSLSTVEEGRIAELSLARNVAHEFSGQTVTVVGNVSGTREEQSGSLPRIDVESIALADGQEEAHIRQSLTGSQPFLNILCKFPDYVSVPHDPGDYASLFESAEPGLDHYWRQISYDNINIVGTDTVDQWYTFPHNRSYYVSGSSVDLYALADDCVALADDDIDFNATNYVGLNLMFNADIGCCAWGGGNTVYADGQFRSFRMTWMPTWSQEHDTMAHEMGHAFNLPHSSGPADNVPAYIYVSNWDVMSKGGGTCATFDLTWGCLATGTIADYVDLDVWIPDSRRMTVTTGSETTITLERLNLPVSGTNDLIAIIPINGSSIYYYTVEARFQDSGGYDQNIPGNAIIIHNVLTTRTGNSGPALVVDANDGNDNINDAGAMWTVGETFYDAANNITINVQSAGASSFTVFINNNYVKPPDAGLPTGDIYPASPKFTWTDTTSSEWFNLRIENGSNTEVVNQWYQRDVGINCPANNCSITINTALPDGSYNWFVRSWKSVGGYSSWDGPNAFTIIDSALTAPSSITLTNPTNPTFTWDEISVAGVEWYKLSIVGPSGYQYLQWYEASVCTANVCTVSPNIVLHTNGSYTWYVKGWGSDGYGPWSDSASFTLNVSIPDIPSGLSPTVSNGFPTSYVWNNDQKVTWYNLYISGPSGVLHNVWYQKGNSALTCSGTCSFSPAIVYANGNYTWKVQAYGPGGLRSSATEAFAVNIPIPDTPSGLSVSMPNGLPTAYEWNDDVKVTWYNLYITGPSGIIHNVWYQKGNSAMTCSGTCSISPALNYSNGNHTWKVQAYGPGGIRSSATEAFAVNIAMPDIPSGLSETMPNGFPTSYEWNDDVKATWYNLYIAGPSGVIHNVWYQKGNSAMTCSGTCSISPALNYGNGNYTWYVQAYGPGGSRWSAAEPFSVNITIPDVASGLSESMTDGIPTAFVWNNDTKVTWYNLYITGPGGVIHNAWYQKGNSAMTCGGTCTVSPLLAYSNGNYTWYIQAYGPGGSRWSAAEPFSVSIGTPPATTLIAPADNTATTNATVQFQWNKVTIATWYMVEFKNMNGVVVGTQWFSNSVCTGGTCTAQVTIPTTATSWRVQTYGALGYGQFSTSRNITALN